MAYVKNPIDNQDAMEGLQSVFRRMTRDRLESLEEQLESFKLQLLKPSTIVKDQQYAINEQQKIMSKQSA